MENIDNTTENQIKEKEIHWKIYRSNRKRRKPGG